MMIVVLENRPSEEHQKFTSKRGYSDRSPITLSISKLAFILFEIDKPVSLTMLDNGGETLLI